MTKFIEFYFDFSSPYAYLGFKEIKKYEKKYPFQIKYMPIFLGGLHNSAGITPAAFNKIKSKHMIQDTKLVANKKNIKFSFNRYFPVKTVNFMRGALIAKDNNYEKIYVEKIFDSIWRDGLNMNDNIIINKVLKNLDLNPNIFFEKVSDFKIKDKLKKLTNDALKKGIFGAPTYYVNRKIFFGQDRLIYAIDEIKR
tara:strand:+ start:433 stop:1020 length:588 start_codon:yes stop_codon:yes gene_type:complete